MHIRSDRNAKLVPDLWNTWRILISYTVFSEKQLFIILNAGATVCQIDVFPGGKHFQLLCSNQLNFKASWHIFQDQMWRISPGTGMTSILKSFGHEDGWHTIYGMEGERFNPLFSRRGNRKQAGYFFFRSSWRISKSYSRCCSCGLFGPGNGSLTLTHLVVVLVVLGLTLFEKSLRLLHFLFKFLQISSHNPL